MLSRCLSHSFQEYPTSIYYFQKNCRCYDKRHLFFDNISDVDENINFNLQACNVTFNSFFNCFTAKSVRERGVEIQ